MKKATAKNTIENAKILYNLGNNYYEKQDFEKALKYYTESLDIKKRVHKSDHPDIVSTLNNISLAYKAKGDSDKASEFSLKSEEMKKRLSSN